MRRLLVALVFALLAITSAVPADDYISSPSRVPLFSGYRTPVIEPGGKGTLNFTVENRYEEPLYNVVITLEIYRYATMDTETDIQDVENRPVFENGELVINATYDTIGVNGRVVFSVLIRVPSGAPDGVYFVRTAIEFTHNGTRHFMCSPGFFPREVWAEATADFALNLTLLSDYLGREVEGIVPDTSFSVKSGPNYLIFAAIVGITVFMAVYWLYREYRGVEVTRLDEEYYRLKGKYRELERELRRKIRKGET